MTKQTAKITIGYDKYLLGLSDAVAVMSILAQASHLTQSWDKATDKYTSCLRLPIIALTLATEEEINTAAYVEKNEE